jgi:hypothetical protein
MDYDTSNGYQTFKRNLSPFELKSLENGYNKLLQTLVTTLETTWCHNPELNLKKSHQIPWGGGKKTFPEHCIIRDETMFTTPHFQAKAITVTSNNDSLCERGLSGQVLPLPRSFLNRREPA